VDDYYTFRVIGRTIDDAAGEAFDKAAKIMGLPYPGGPIIDRLALEGDPYKYTFPEPSIPDFDYSFSGLKTSFLYFIRDRLKKDPSFIENNKNDLAASIQRVIVEVLLKKLILAAKKTNISQIAIAGGVSANSELRKVLQKTKSDLNWQVFIPKFDYTTDNAAMIAIAGYYKYLKNDFAPQHIAPYTRSGQ
jgi:N6-L-threonylcarbamoyladenine synthase